MDNTLWETTASQYEMTDEDVEYIIRSLVEDGYLDEDDA